MRRLLGAACAVLLAGISCVRTLPDQDRRIVAAAPEARISADLLWKEFSTNASAAGARYHGRAIVVSGNVSTLTKDPGRTAVLFALDKEQGVEARLLEDQAAEIAARAQSGSRMTLKCFCEGLQGNVVLKSCVKP